MSDYPLPDHIQRSHADGQIIYLLYFGVPDGKCHKLPVGSEFECIYSPSPYQQAPDWKLVSFRIVERIEPYGKNKGKWGRFYVVQNERILEDSEVEFYSLEAERAGG